MSGERQRRTVSGWVTVPILVIAYIAVGYGFYGLVRAVSQVQEGVVPVAEIWGMVGCGLGFGLLVFLSAGFFTLQPNEAAVLLLFGAYKGTVRVAGFHWANPLLRKIKVSLRTRNFNTDKLKVNDQRGNPTEIAAVVVLPRSDVYLIEIGNPSPDSDTSAYTVRLDRVED